jgi:serine/threonine-protein kinase
MSAVPSTFGKYFLTEKIATGGMAEIYLAKILGPGGFEKFLGIKKIHPALSGESQFVEMFVAEAKTLVGLTHGNIVPIYELGMVDSTYFIAMEYIDGPTLEQLLTALRRSDMALSPAMTAYICAEILKGLDYAHRKGEGVIHRDLSPRNVMLSREGEVKLVDFGIAVAKVDRASEQGHAGDPAGSYPYMSPEQVRGDVLDGRSDVFATGILLWEMLTGERLFNRPNDQETLAAVIAGDIAPPSKFCPAAQGVLDVVCANALERDLDKRYQSAGDFLVAINRFLYSQAETVTPKDVSSFIAKHCPPTTQEFARPSTLGMGEEEEQSGTTPMAAKPGPKRKRSGTVPMERPQGKKRAETVQSFATHVTLRRAFSTDDADALESQPPKLESQPPKLESQPPKLEPTAAEPTPTTSDPQTPVTKDDSKLASLFLPAAGGIALLVAGVVLFVGRSNGDTQPQPAATIDAAIALPPDAAPPPADATPQPLSTEPDARPVAKKKDAGAVVRRRPDAAAEKAMGSIRVGANPWADVYLDGKAIGRAPGNFEVPAGPHSLELRFHDKSKTIQIDVKPSQLTSLGVVDFTE